MDVLERLAELKTHQKLKLVDGAVEQRETGTE